MNQQAQTSDFKHEASTIEVFNKEQLKAKVLQRKRKQRLHDSLHKQVKTNTVEDFSCPICLEVIVRATTTTCGHTFCENCILESFLLKARCPICKNDIKNFQFIYCGLLDNLIKDYISTRDQEEQEQFNQRHTQQMEANHARKSLSLEVGADIDVLDKDQIWCAGKVIKVFKNDVHVQYTSRQKTSEVIKSDSVRLAPKGYFSGRREAQYHHINPLNYMIEYSIGFDMGQSTSEMVDFIHIMLRPN